MRDPNSPLARLRKALDLTVDELAHRLQIAPGTMASAEYARNGHCVSQRIVERIRIVFPKEAEQFFANFVPKSAGPPAPRTPRVHSLLDPEIAAMSTVYHVLEPLDPDARKRIVEWVLNRLKQ